MYSISSPSRRYHIFLNPSIRLFSIILVRTHLHSISKNNIVTSFFLLDDQIFIAFSPIYFTIHFFYTFIRFPFINSLVNLRSCPYHTIISFSRDHTTFSLFFFFIIASLHFLALVLHCSWSVVQTHG